MKITNLLLALTLAGFGFCQAFAQGIPHFNSAPSRSIGDSETDTRPQGFQTSKKLSDGRVSPAVAMDQSIIIPTASHEVFHHGVGNGHSSYDLGNCGPSAGHFWFSAETLLWFPQKTNAPALVTNSDFGIEPVLGNAGVLAVFGGGDGIDFGMQPGFRVSGGTYLTADQKVGLSGRAYGLYNASESYNQTSDGSGGAANPSIGLPFYNLFLNQEDAFDVAFQDAGGLDKEGTVRARSDLDMIGAEGSLSFLLSRTAGHRMDLLGGYTFNRLKNSIGVETVSTGFRFPNAGLVTTTNDLFETENVFHGGHLGVLSSVVRSRVSLTTLAKVSFGNMRQNGSIRGFSILDDTVDPPTSLGAGILTQPSNIGEFSRDRFAFIPELGVKMGLAVRENLHFTVGYTMMMWSGVALAGEQIDSAVDPTQLVLPNPGTRPAPLFRESSFWMQGIDLGLTLMY